jgi:hypothetical protein
MISARGMKQIDYSGKSQKGKHPITPNALLATRRLVGSGSILTEMVLQAKRFLWVRPQR